MSPPHTSTLCELQNGNKACPPVFTSESSMRIDVVSRMTKVMVGETCSPSMQGKVMGYLALGDAMGNIIGVPLKLRCTMAELLL